LGRTAPARRRPAVVLTPATDYFYRVRAVSSAGAGEYSAVGGWIVTRGAGQNSTYFGKIEDMVICQEYVTSSGLIETKEYPALATGHAGCIGRAHSGGFRLLLARELDRLVTALVPKLLAADDADGIVAVIGSAVEFATTHPVLSKVLQDEPELVGGFVIAELPTLIDRLLVLAEPVVRRLADLDERARFDIPVLGEWVARVVITMVVAPPRDPPEEFLRKVLLPVLG